MLYLLKYTRLYSFDSINLYLTATTCFLIAAKSRDEPVPIDYLVEWYIYFEFHRLNPKSTCVYIDDNKKKDYKEIIQDQELDILEVLDFDTEVELPYKYLAEFRKTHSDTIFTKSDCSKYAVMFMNDAFLTTVPLYFPPQIIAAACIYMACLYTMQKNKSLMEEIEKFNTSEWYKSIDETLDLETMTKVKDEIKKCYDKKASSS